jgi:hypothetical protein
MWAAVPSSAPGANSRNSAGNAGPTPAQASGESSSSFIYAVISIFIAVTGWFGGSALIKAIRDWRRRHQVPLIFLGRPSTGKSWMWRRLVDPDVAPHELEKIARSDVSVKKKTPQRKPLGRYEIIPIYIDTPGGQAGQQVNSLLEETGFLKKLRRILIPTKSVWIIMLATTPEIQINRNSPDDKKIDKLYIEQQLGHLDLPLGILSSTQKPKPQMVITCIGKFDLFAEHDSKAKSSGPARTQVESIFLRHISRIKKECKDQVIPFELVICSALEGWGTMEIWRHIENAIFSK